VHLNNLNAPVLNVLKSAYVLYHKQRGHLDSNAETENICHLRHCARSHVTEQSNFRLLNNKLH